MLLPEELVPFEAQIIATQKACVKIIPQQASPALLWQSKIGGMPYLPKHVAFPVNAEGAQLFFLAQFNFEELPPLPLFPTKGILQFYISDEAAFGMNPLNPYDQNNFRVLFFEEPIQAAAALVNDFTFLRQYGALPLPAAASHALLFEPEYEFLPADDYRFEATFGESFFEQFGEDEWEVFRAYTTLTSAKGHKLGGYPDFAQEDPRKPEDKLELLFQLDSDDDIGCLWGDMGLANFFIRLEDLARRDFSKVLYNWDSC